MEAAIVCWGYIGRMENKIETNVVSWGYIGIMEKKTEVTIAKWGYIDKMGKKMEATNPNSKPPKRVSVVSLKPLHREVSASWRLSLKCGGLAEGRMWSKV